MSNRFSIGVIVFTVIAISLIVAVLIALPARLSDDRMALFILIAISVVIALVPLGFAYIFTRQPTDEVSAEPLLSEINYPVIPDVVVKWWDDMDVVSGIFEGGGARGILYSGALLAMEENAVWFNAVAGTSVGSIAAALIAAGARPDMLKRSFPEVLKEINTTPREGIRRIYNKGYYYRASNLRQWINEAIYELTGVFQPSFERLYELSGIELYVVSADISRKQLLVFHHAITPNALVIDAVLSSAAIPAAFPSMSFSSGFADEIDQINTLIDGGAWSNFPTFVFLDDDFRRGVGLEPYTETDRILGFVLDAEDPLEEPLNAAAGFPTPETDLAGTVNQKDKIPTEWAKSGEPVTATARVKQFLDLRRQSMSTIPAAIRYPLALILGILLIPILFPSIILNLDIYRRLESGRWRKPKDGVGSLIDSILEFFWSPWIYLPILAMNLLAWGFGLYQLGRYLILSEEWITPFIKLPPLASIFLRLEISLLIIIIVFAALLIQILIMAILLINTLFIKVWRKLLFGTVTTLMAVASIPWWIAQREDIVHLTVPPDIGALSFDLTEEQIENASKSAKAETLETLQPLLAKWRTKQ